MVYSGNYLWVFMDSASHSKLHGKYLQDFRPTDVIITFPPDRENELAGEICVSVDQAILESGQRNQSFEVELSLYLVHGWLHLVGFDDLDDIDRKIMRQEEQRVMDYVKNSPLYLIFGSLNSTTICNKKELCHLKLPSLSRRFRNAFLTGLLVFLPQVLPFL